MLYIRIVSPFPEMEQFIQATVQRCGAEGGGLPGRGGWGAASPAARQAAARPAGTRSGSARWRAPSGKPWPV